MHSVVDQELVHLEEEILVLEQLVKVMLVDMVVVTIMVPHKLQVAVAVEVKALLEEMEILLVLEEMVGLE